MTAQQTVPVTLPGDVWWRLGSIAEARGVRIADLLRDAAGAVVAAGHADELVVELRRARDAGWRAPRRERPVPFDLVEWRRLHEWGGFEWDSPRWEPEVGRARDAA